jgi:hypothetical protein
MKGISTFLITIALIAGMVGCGDGGNGGGESYTLTVASTSGGSVVEPGEGTSTYDEGTVVDLVAEAEEGYIFANWTGDVDTIANVDAVTTTITMSGDYYITANFVLATRATDWYDLYAIRDNLGGAYVLMNDLDSTTPGYEELASATANGGKGWEPIGTSDNQFTGIFDGQGGEIRDVFISRPDESYGGLFGYVANSAAIRDIGVMNVDVTGYDYVGCLAGRNDGTVADSYSVGSVAGRKFVGGLVGFDSGSTVNNSYYDYDESLINGDNSITIGALYDEDFEQWLANNKSLDIDERLSQEDGYYLINDVDDFKQLLVFGQNSTLKFRLTSDLDLASEPGFYIPYLAGEFDGNGHAISNLSLNLDFVSPLGLFGRVADGATLTHIGVESVDIAGYQDVGGLVGESLGAISDSYSTGSVTGYEYIGGLMGANIGTVINCYATGNVSGKGYVGGLVGRNIYSWGFRAGVVSNCSATCSVTGYEYIGGLVGGNGGDVGASHASGSVTGSNSSSYCAGGLVGGNGGNVGASHATGSVTAALFWVGGLVGRNVGTVSDSYATGSVTGGTNVGGLMGGNCGNVSNCYATGSVAANQDVGGLLGDNHYGTVSDSYATGSVAGNLRAGGLVGTNLYGIIVSNCFWDTETSGQATSDGGTGKTTAEMKDIATFSGAFWSIIAVANPSVRNLSYIWNIVNNVTYPFLSWQPV